MMLLLAITAAIAVCSSAVPVADQDVWAPVDAILDDHIASGAFPGCVALIADKTGILYQSAKGHYTYGLPAPLNDGHNPAMSMDTLFDMASCTKVTMTTTAVAQMYQRGEIALEDKIGDILGSDFNVNGKQDITILNCLLHDAGFYPDPIPGWNSEEFDCPETRQFHPAENFSCMDKIWKSYNNVSLQHPIGSTYVYSDLSYITLMFVVGTVAMKNNLVDPSTLLPSCASFPRNSAALKQCYFEAYIRKYVIEAADMTSSGFLPPQSVHSKAAPTCNDTRGYMHTTIQGVVQDGNTYAMGGISGHAGLFSNAMDVYRLSSKIMWPTPQSTFFNSTTAARFLPEYNHTQSSRALGWNTNDHSVPDQGFSGVCGSLSARTWMHTGYTGTMICGDQDRELIVILLTNRVYPDPANTKIMEARRVFSNAVQQIYDANFAKNVL